MKSAILLLVCLVAATAVAGLDPDPDSMGFYFDTTGSNLCTSAPQFTPFPAYLLLMNPRGVTDGFACRVRFEGPPYYILGTTEPGTPDPDAPHILGYNVTHGEPYPVNHDAIVLVAYTLMVQAVGPFDLSIGPPSPSVTGCAGPAVHGQSFPGDPAGWRCCGVSSRNVNIPVARVNAYCGFILADEAMSFGAVKGLFR